MAAVNPWSFFGALGPGAAVGTAAAAATPALLQAGAGAAASAFGRPKIPAMPKMPKPIAPGKGPVNVSQTAGMERARIASRGRGTGTAGLVLTPLSGSSETPVKRTTLLGS